MKSRRDYKQNSKIEWRREDLAIYGLIFFILALQSVYTVLLNSMTTNGVSLQDMYEQTRQLQVENDKLRTQLLDARSLRVLTVKAQQLGLKEASNGDYLFIR